MADLNDDSLKRLIGDDPILTSASVRIRQDEQTLASLARHFTMLRREAEGIAKALKEAGVSMKGLGGMGGTGGGIGRIGDTTVAGSFTPPQHSPPDMALDLSTAGGRGGAGGGGGRMGRITSAFVGGDGQLTKLGAGAVYGAQMLDAGIKAMDQRIERGYQYSLSADRMNMLFQQMKGMSQTAIQDTYRQPLTQYKLGAGGINALLGLEAGTGISAAQQAASVEALRISSGFSVNAQQAAGIMGSLASPQVANRMFMMSGTSLVRPGGGYRPMNEVMQSLVRSQGLTDPRILKGAMAPGSVTRANLTNIGVGGEFQTQLLQYAQQNLAFQQKGGSGMYDPSNKAHQKLMGIDENFAMQQEESDRKRIEREENFYSRQADNFADLEKQTQRLISAMGGLENVLSGLFGFRTSTKGFSNIGSGVGTAIGGIAGAFMGNPILGALAGSQIGRFVGSIIPTGDPDTNAAIRERAATSTGGGRVWGTPATSGGKYVKAPGIASSNTFSGGSKVVGAQPGIRLYGPPQPKSGIDALTRRGPVQPGSSTFASPSSYVGVPGGAITDPKLAREIKMAYTRVYGLDGKVTTLAELTRHLINVNPDAVRAFQDAAMAANDEGTIIGISDADRTFSQQYDMFMDRYQQVDYPADKEWDGKFWKLRTGKAPAASPGSPYANHVSGIAFDIRGDKKWLGANAHRFGLKGFAHMGEDWHFELVVPDQKGFEYNEATGFKKRDESIYAPGGVGYNPNMSEKDIVAALAERGLHSVTWNKNVNGKSQQVGIEFLPVKGGGVVAKRDLNKLANGVSGAYSDRFNASDLLRTRRAAQQPQIEFDEKGRITGESMMTLLATTGFKESDLIEMFAVSRRESGGKPGELNPVNEHSIGLFQINVADSANLKFIQALGYTPDDLYDPIINAKVAYAMMESDRSRGGSGFSPWGPYKEMHHMTGTKWQAASRLAMDMGLISKPYTGPKDYDGMTAYPTIKEWEIATGQGDPDPGFSRGGDRYVPSPMTVPARSAGDYQTYGDSAGGKATVIGGSTITVSPTININTSGNNLDQDLEGMARKVAMMLEREVNRTMIRRT